MPRQHCQSAKQYPVSVLCNKLQSTFHWKCMGGEWKEKSKCEISVRVIVWVVCVCVCEVVLYAQLDSGWGDWLAATSCAKLLLSCSDSTQLSVFIYAWSDRGGWVVCKAEYFSLQGLFFSQYSLLRSLLSLSLHSLCSFHFRIVRNDISRHFVFHLCRIPNWRITL